MKLKLINGRIPAKEECPYKSRCPIEKAGACKHQGVNHPVAFSCAMARGYELIDRMDECKGN